MIANAQKTWILLALGGAAVASAGCGPQFDSPSRIDSLRVLAVQKDRPYAKPGDRVRLTMLWTDGSDDAGAERPIQIAWLAGCHNPLGELYAGCFESLADPGAIEVGMGDEFSFTVPDDIISSRPPPPDPRQPPYGLSYVFFAACAGTLEPAPASAGFPLVCVGANGETLGSNDFVAGYTAIYTYDEFTNANPVVRGITVDGRPLADVCVDPASAAAAAEGGLGPLLGGGDESSEPPPACAGSVGEPQRPDCELPDAPCFSGIEAGDLFDRRVDVRPEIHAVSIEPDSVTKAAYGRDFEEQMWINYYATAGFLRTDVRLLNDATGGLNEDFFTELSLPLVPGPVTLWAVVHDNRGGAGWARGTIWID